MNAITNTLELSSKEMSKMVDTLTSQLSQYFKRKKHKMYNKLAFIPRKRTNNSSRLNADSYEESSGEKKRKNNSSRLNADSYEESSGEGSLAEDETAKEENNPSSNSINSKLQDMMVDILTHSKEEKNERNYNNKRSEKDSKEKEQSHSKKEKKIKSDSEEEKEIEEDFKEKKQSDSKKEKKVKGDSEEEEEIEKDSKEKKIHSKEEKKEKDDSKEQQSHSKKVIDSREESLQSLEQNRKSDGIVWSAEDKENASATHSKKLQKAKKIMGDLLFSIPEKKGEDVKNATKKDNDKDSNDDKKKDRKEDTKKANMKDSKEDKKKDYATKISQSEDELQVEMLPVSASAEIEVNELSSPAESVETLEKKVKKEDTKNDKEKDSKKFKEDKSKNNDTKSNNSEDKINVQIKPLSSLSEIEINELSDLLSPLKSSGPPASYTTDDVTYQTGPPASYTTSSLAPAPHSPPTSLEPPPSSKLRREGQCYIDNPKRILPSRAPVEGGLTIEKCKKLCFEERNYSYAGVQNGDECFCGNDLPNTPAPDAECSVPCSGDEAQKCGGWFRMNIYPNQRLLDNRI